MIDKETIHKVLSSLWKNDDNVGKMCYNQALQDAQIAFDSLPEEPVSEALEKVALEYATHYDKNWSEVKDGYIAENEVEAFKAGAEWGKNHAMAEIQAQSMALAHGCPKEEPVCEDLEKASKEWLEPQLDKSYDSYGEGKMMELTHFDGYAMLDAIEFGAKWQEQQLEKNRLARCDAQTEEEAEREQEFVMQHIKKYHCQPTFSDAIEWGMNLQREGLL